MANFYNPANDPQNIDGISEIYVGKGKTVIVALYGGGPTGDDLFVRAESKTFVAITEDTGRRQKGPIRFFNLSGLIEGETILRATKTKDGFDDYTTPAKLYVVGTNGELLGGSDPRYVYPNNNEKYPLNSHFGPAMAHVRGLAVHVTGGDSDLSSLKGTWEANPASAHFAISKTGNVAQYVALCFQAWAEGPGNPFFISVEIVGTPDARGLGAEMTEPQIRETAKLFRWLQGQFGFPLQLATPLLSDYAWVGNVNKDFKTAIDEVIKESGVAGSSLKETCVAASGLSCHAWLQPGIKPCPGLEIIKQLPKIVQRARLI